ncbi:MAG: SusC/RagA family TonB-linked outer membrane protein [Balneolaceae bacterium]
MDNKRLRKGNFPKPIAAFSSMVGKGIQFCIAFLLIAGLATTDIMAQDRVTITGVVTDAEDETPLPGVSITVPGSSDIVGSTVGTTTNMDGEYTIRVPEELNTLRFSFIGYDPQEIEIDGRTEINVELGQDVELLDDVVVVGYGVQDRREITSSVTSIDSEDFQRGNINDSQELLQGKVAGLQITRPGGDPNAGFSIRLRGLSTIGADTEPLVVVDGVLGANFNTIDPNDIESIEVLKDASAAAIYGTRGSNGVILITTKKGDAGGTDGIAVNYNGQLSTSIVGNQYETMSASEYRALEDVQNEELTSNQGIAISDDGASTDWFDAVTQTAYTQSHNLSISGGDATTNYRVSGTFRDVEAIQKGAGNQQLNTRLNVTHRALDDNLTLTGSLALTSREQDIGLGEVFRYATVSNPTRPIYNEDGTFRQPSGFDTFNPVAINELSTVDTEQDRQIISLRAEYDFSDVVDGLSGSGFYSRENEEWFRGEYYGRDLDFRGAGRSGLALRESGSNFNQLAEATANYRNTFGDVRVESVAGYSYQEFESAGQFAEGGDFVSDNLLYNNLNFAREFDKGQGTVSSYANTSKIIAGFSRVNLTIDDTYFLSGTYRREGSSRFGEENKWGNFFAGSVGAELTNLIDIPGADEFKVRVSYGETGNNAPFDGISQLRFGSGPSFLVGGEFQPSLGPVSNPNPNLKWEIKREVNAGVDFAFFDSRFTGSVDYYNSTTDDLLLEFDVPVPPNLFPTQWVNIGEVSNEGVELALGYMVLQDENKSWNVGITAATFSSVLESLSSGDLEFGERQLISNVGAPGLNDTPMIRVKEGRSFGELWGPKFAGVNEEGDFLFEDADGELVGSGELTSADDQVIGNGLPDFTFGIDNTFNYKNWDLNMFWRGAFGHDLANTFDVFYSNPNFAGSYNLKKGSEDSPIRESPQWSSLYVEDASFMRLENLSIGYNVNLPAEAGVKELRLSVTGNNLWTITGYGGVDPEVRFSDVGPTDNAGREGGSNLLAPGIERRNQWFTQTSFTFGVNVGF